MNHIYKVVRCSSTGLFKAVSELGKSQGKGKGLTKKLMAVGVLAAMASTGAQAGDVLSGSDNTATGLDSVVAGGRNNNATVGADSVYIGASTVSGGNSNTAQSAGATVAGGVNNTAGQVNNNSNQIVDDGQYATVSGGENNNAEGNWSTISGGVNNVASGWSSVISGGSSNISSESFSTVSGGRRNNASGTFSSISGGDGNIASNRYATVSGGLNNEASGDSSVVGGGVLNRSSNKYATVSGGLNNKANGIASVVGGGGGGGWANGVFYDYGNTASGNGSVVGGGGYNPTFLLSEADNFGNTASGQNSVVDGGESNIASGEHSSVGGGSKNHAAVKGSTVGGGRVNTAGYVDADGKPILVNGREVGSYSIVAGGRNNKAEGDDSFVGGGVGNSIGFNASDAVIAGGVSNNITSTASNGFIGGGTENTVSASHGSVVAGEGNTASAMHSFIGGGQINTASGSHSVVGGGYQNINEGIGGVIAGGRENQILKIGGVIAGGTKNKVLGTHGSVGGGEGNIAGKENTYPNPASHDNGSRATVAGGWNNEATGASSFIGGGQFNKAVADTTTIGGGANNTAGNPIGSGDTSGAGATVGGGQSNSATGGGSVIAGGGGNRSSGYSSTVGGGYRNLASGKNSTVGGGTKNIAKGEGSFVAGIDNTASTDYGVAMGYNNKLGGTNSVLIGQNNNTTRNDIFILGSNTTSTQANSVLLGNNTTDRQASYIDGATIGGVRYSRFAGMGTAPYGVVSVGSVGGERQLVNVAAGALSATSTDAVNGSQVFEITEKQNIVINKNRTDIDKNTGDITNIQNSIEGVVVDVSAKADKTYVDDENAKQDTIINNNRDEFVSANNTTNERITTEVGRIDGELEGQGESITTNNQASIDRDDVQNTELERLEEVKANKTYVDDENDKQNTVINTKADTTYVDNQNNAQNTIITQNRTDIDKNTGDITNIQNSIEGVVVDVSAKADVTYVNDENAKQDTTISNNRDEFINANTEIGERITTEVGRIDGELGEQSESITTNNQASIDRDKVTNDRITTENNAQNTIINNNRDEYINNNTVTNDRITTEVDRIDGVDSAQDKLISAKADITYVDDENAKQDTIISNNRDEFIAANTEIGDRITTEVGRIDGELGEQGELIATNKQASIDRDDTQNTELGRLEEVKADKTYVDDENDKQNTVINTKADTTYVDNQNNAQNTIITQNRTDIDKNTGDITNIQNSIEGVVVDVSAKADITYVDSENTAQNEVIASNNQDAIERNNATNVKVDSNTTAINKGFSVGNGNSSNKFDLGSTIEIAGDANTIVSTTDTGLKIGIASDVTLNSITLGTNTMTSEGLMVGGVSITNEKGINAGGKVISGVADAVNDDEAVNYGQIKAGLVGVAKNIKGDGNISVEANDEGETLVSLNKDIALDSVTVGANTLTANGLSIGGVSITNEGGINAGGQSIGGVGNGLIGLDSRDAINGGQMFSSVNSMVGLLGGNASQNGGNITMSNIGGTGFNTIDEAIKANKTAIEEVRNIVVNTPSPKDIVADSVVTDSVVSGSVVADSVVVGDVTIDDAGINAGGKPITNVGNGQNADDAVNLGQLEDAVANGNKGFIVTTQGENATTVANGGSLDMSNTDGNVVVSSNSSTNGVSFDLNKDIKVDSVTATTVTSDKLIAGQTTVSDKGISIGSGDKVVELTASGLNNGGNRISNISAGIEKGDAVNYGQLSGLEKRINGSMSELGYRINDVEDGANAGVSVAMASSALPQAFVPGKSMIGGGAATYNGQSAVAVGLSKVTNDGRFVFKISGSADTQGNAGGSVGAGFQF